MRLVSALYGRGAGVVALTGQAAVGFATTRLHVRHWAPVFNVADEALLQLDDDGRDLPATPA